MGSLLVMIAVIVLISIIFSVLFDSPELAAPLIIIVVIITIVSNIVVPSLLPEKLVREVKLVSSNIASDSKIEGTSEYYVFEEIKQAYSRFHSEYYSSYTYTYEIPSSITENEIILYDTETISSRNVKIIENSNDIAILQVYSTKTPVSSFWLLFSYSAERYVFNIPKGTKIVKTID